MQSNVEILYGVEVFKMVMIFFKIVSVFVAFFSFKIFVSLENTGKNGCRLVAPVCNNGFFCFVIRCICNQT